MSEIKDIPKHWQIKKLAEVCTSTKGKMPKLLKEEKTEDCYIPYINIKAFEKGIFAEYTDGVKCNLCEDDDLLMVWDGARCGLIGKAKKGAVGSTLMKILPKENIHKEYLYHFISSKFWTLNTKPKGVGIPHIEPTLLWNFDLVVPPLREQQAIVSKIEELLSDLENGKQQLQTAQQQLKVYRQSLLKWAFEGKLTNKNVKDGELPEGWKKVQISDVAETFGGYAFKSSEFLSQGKYQVLRMGNIRPGIIRYDESPVFLNEVHESVLNRALLQFNDIIITQTGTRKKRDYGFTVLIRDQNLLLNQRIAAIRFKETYLPKFFLYFSWTDFFKDQFFANETGNVGQGNVGMKAVTETIIPYCSLEEQQLIVDELESKLTVCDKIEEIISQSLLQAESLKQSILKRAFEGKLVKNHVSDNLNIKL
jgi:type I restriction enzyme, S subunit